MTDPTRTSNAQNPSDAPAGTRAALIAAGLRLFGQKGFAAASTRELAAEAGTNVASIAYHFGGKEGLHAACTEEVARQLSGVVGTPRDHRDLAPDRARSVLVGMVRLIVTFMLTERRAADVVAFVLRELTSGEGRALETLYGGLFEPKHREVCQLWSIASGQRPQDGEREDVRLAVFAAIGQVVYFRIALPIVSRRMGWQRVGAEEAAAVADTIIANLDAALDRSRTK